MDRKTLTIVLAIALIGCFFLPLTNSGSGSAFDIVKGPSYGSSTNAMLMKYLWILIPLSGIMLLIGAMNNESYIVGRGLWAFLPLLTVLFLLIGMPLINGMAIGDIFKTIGKGYGIGLWIMIITSLVLAFFQPRR